MVAGRGTAVVGTLSPEKAAVVRCWLPAARIRSSLRGGSPPAPMERRRAGRYEGALAMVRRSRATNRAPNDWAHAAVVLAALLLSLPARACPDCPEGIRRQVRAGIFDEGFVRNVGMAALPFGVLSCITAMIHFGFAGRRRRRE